MKFTVSMKLNGDPVWTKAEVIPAQQGSGDTQQGGGTSNP
jgi:hypothetical protein